jgi:t-SNARE complex subunit (syntaxin)
VDNKTFQSKILKLEEMLAELMDLEDSISNYIREFKEESLTEKQKKELKEYDYWFL